MAFEIDFSPDGLEHLEALREFDQNRILREIEQQLTHQPLAVTKRKKPMRSNLIAARELRIGDFRVYYDVDVANAVVLVRAIGFKVHNRVMIAGEEVELS